MNKIFFTADTHFGSKEILESAKRPYDSVEEMDQSMIYNWNMYVKKDENDIVYHLGDFGDPACYSFLNGKIILVRGGCDNKEIQQALDEQGIRNKASNHPLVLKGFKCKLVHSPSEITDKDSFYLFGHIHNLLRTLHNGLNVGVDYCNFRPIDLETVVGFCHAITNDYSNATKGYWNFM